MKYKFVMMLLLGLLTLSLASAVTEEYEINRPIDLQFQCTIDNAIPSSNTAMNISLYHPSGSTILNNVGTTAQGLGSFNYTYTFRTGGTYSVKIFCYNGTASYGETNYYSIYGVGNTKDKGITETSIFLILLIVISLFIYMKLSKFLGGFLIFICGIGMLFTIIENGWIGWLIIVAGFIMVVYSLLETGRKR